MKSRTISILKDTSDISKLLRLKGSGTLKALRTHQYCRTEILNIIPHMNIEFENIQVVKSILQSITGIRNNGNDGGNIYLRSSWCQRHQCYYLIKKRILQSEPQLYSWQCQVMNHRLICLRTLLEDLGI